MPFTLSTVSACSLAEVAAAAQRPFWFQLYMMRDRGFMADLLARAQGQTAVATTQLLDFLPAALRDL